MITNFKRRLETLEHEKAISENNAHKNVVPYLNTLERGEVSDLGAWIYGDKPFWKPNMPDDYYAGLLYRAMKGEIMPEGYDWLNGLLDGKLPERRVTL